MLCLKLEIAVSVRPEFSIKIEDLCCGLSREIIRERNHSGRRHPSGKTCPVVFHLVDKKETSEGWKALEMKLSWGRREWRTK